MPFTGYANSISTSFNWASACCRLLCAVLWLNLMSLVDCACCSICIQLPTHPSQHSLTHSHVHSVIQSLIRLFFLVATCSPSNGSEKKKNLFTLQSCQDSTHLPHPFRIDLSSSCGNCLQNCPMTQSSPVSSEHFKRGSIENPVRSSR